MELVFESFTMELSEMRKHIQFINDLKNDINSKSANFEYSKSNSRKKYDYNSLIISLYGLVEHYIEQFIISYIELIEKNIFFYGSLNEKMIENHFKQSMFLLNRIIESKHHKFLHLKKEDVIKNLNNCIIGSTPYSLNKDAFVINTGNLKHLKICDLFNSLNIKFDIEMRNYDGFNLKNTENIFNTLDNLVQRRNEIAHGGTSDILDNSEIIPFVDFIEKYFTTIYQLLNNKIEKEVNCFKKDNFSLFIEKVKLFNGNILGLFDGVKFNLSIGDEILIEKLSADIISSKIIDLKIFPNNDVTIKLNKKVKENYKYYIFDKTGYQNGLCSRVAIILD